MKSEIHTLKTVSVPATGKWKKRAQEIIDTKAWRKDAAAIAVKVLDALEDQGLTQRDLAERLDVSPQAVNKIVKGRQNLTVGTIRKIEAALTKSLISL